MKKILVIEDEIIVRENVVEILESNNYQVQQASNGKKALEILNTFLPDLIISDISMPEMNGYETLKEIQKNSMTSSIPFIFLSAKTGDESIRIGMNRGADDYLVKPFNAKDLLETVEIRLNKKKRFDKMREELVNSIAMAVPHELRTPLVAISGYSQLLLEDYNSLSDDEIYNYIQKIRISNSRLYIIIEKFIIYSELLSIESNPDKKNMLSQEIVIQADKVIIDQSIQKAEFFERRNDLYLSLEECNIKISEVYLSIIISELVENAFKFSKPDNPVTIMGKKEDNSYLIKILDAGIGMSKEELNNINILTQFHRDRIPQSGSGLGISIARKITKLFHGNIQIYSEPCIYTDVSIRLNLFNTFQ